VSMLFVGIDVSKDYSSAQGLDQDRKKLSYVEFGMNGEEFSRLLNMLKTHCEDLSEVMAGMESTVLPHQPICFSLFGRTCLCGNQSSAESSSPGEFHPHGRVEGATQLVPQPPQNVACRFPALRSSEFDSQHSECLHPHIRNRKLRPL